MSQSQPHPDWNSTHDASVVDTTPREKNSSMALLWVIALVAVAAAGLAWYKQQRVDDSALLASSTPAVITPANEAALNPPADSKRADATRPANAERRTAAITPRTIAPRPLAGNPTPTYPRDALRAGAGGTVMVRAVVDANGVPVDVDVVQRSGHRELDRAALMTVRKWRFEPALRNGKAVTSTVQVPVDFKPI